MGISPGGRKASQTRFSEARMPFVRKRLTSSVGFESSSQHPDEGRLPCAWIQETCSHTDYILRILRCFSKSRTNPLTECWPAGTGIRMENQTGSLPFSPSITMISESVNSPALISRVNSPIVFPMSGYWKSAQMGLTLNHVLQRMISEWLKGWKRTQNESLIVLTEITGGEKIKQETIKRNYKKNYAPFICILS